VVARTHPKPLVPSVQVGLSYLRQGSEPNGDGGDQYVGLDRFGRVEAQRWLQSDDVANPMDHFRYGYDANSNRLYRDNLVNATFGELYHADGSGNGYNVLDELTAFARGQLNGARDAIVSDTLLRSQSWGLDILGNWTTFSTTEGGSTTTQIRNHNQQNQIQDIDSAQLTYDNNGNTKQDDLGRTYAYDAWNRLVQATVGPTTVTYTYDALGRRIRESGSGPTRDLYYSASWQVLEEREAGSAKVQYVWSPVYVDALVLRDRDANGMSGDGLEERLYVQQDANFNVTALTAPDGTVLERYVYDPYGLVKVLTPGWGDRSGSVYGWVYLHQGGRQEGATELYHFRNREHSPRLGRWMQQDPIGFDGGDGNFYRYLANTPTGATDPRGLQGDKKDEKKKDDKWKPYMKDIEYELIGKGTTIYTLRDKAGNLFHIEKNAKGNLTGRLEPVDQNKKDRFNIGECTFAAGYNIYVFYTDDKGTMIGVVWYNVDPAGRTAKEQSTSAEAINRAAWGVLQRNANDSKKADQALYDYFSRSLDVNQFRRDPPREEKAWPYHKLEYIDVERKLPKKDKK
jgi:RHS repeat-associated protein